MDLVLVINRRVPRLPNLQIESPREYASLGQDSHVPQPPTLVHPVSLDADELDMRASLMRLAAPAGQHGLNPKPMALLPPIPLYRRVLRAHRKHLPTEMRVLGDEYIKAEFRAHRNVDNPAHLVRHFAHFYPPVFNCDANAS